MDELHPYLKSVAMYGTPMCNVQEWNPIWVHHAKSEQKPLKIKSMNRLNLTLQGGKCQHSKLSFSWVSLSK